MTPQSHRAGILLACAAILAACGGGTGATTAPVATPTPAPTVAVTAAPVPTAAASGGVTAEGPSLQSIIGAAPPAVPAGTSWMRIEDDSGAFGFEVPTTWTQHETVPWAEADGTSSGSILVAGPDTNAIGSDFTKPGVAIGITANPGLRTPRQVVDGDDYSSFCTATPSADENGTGYAASYRIWSNCGGRDGAFVIVIVIAPTGSSALLAAIFQGSDQADLGYVEHMLGSIETGSGTAAATAAPTTPPGNSQGWTASVDQGLLIGEDYADTPAIDPGQGYKFEVRHFQARGATQALCILSDVLRRN